MQLGHVCLSPTLMGAACYCVIREFYVPVYGSDVSPHKRLAAASLCPVHECLMHRMLHTFQIFDS